MGVYSNVVPPKMVGGPGDTAYLIGDAGAAKAGIGTNAFSTRVCVTDFERGFPRPIVVAFNYATAPSSVEYDIYVSQTDTNPNASPSTWTKIGSTTNTAGDQVTIQRGAAGGQQFRFICVQEKTSPGVNVQVSVNM